MFRDDGVAWPGEGGKAWQAYSRLLKIFEMISGNKLSSKKPAVLKPGLYGARHPFSKEGGA